MFKYDDLSEKIVYVEHYCDKCNKETIYMGMELLSNPPKYPHKCPICKTVYNLNNVYPTIKRKRVEINDRNKRQ